MTNLALLTNTFTNNANNYTNKMETKDFLELVDKHNNGKTYGLCSQPFPADKGLDVLIEHFLGKDWHVTMSMSTEQVYTEAICSILDKNQKHK